MQVSLIFPWIGSVAWRASGSGAHEALLVSRAEDAPPPQIAGTRSLRGAPGEAGWLATALSAATGDVALIVPPYFELTTDAVARVAATFAADPDVHVVHADWDVAGAGGSWRTLRVFVDGHDFSEASDLGYLRAYRLSTVRAVGGVELERGPAAEYDLRLKLCERGDPARIEGAIARQLASLREIERDHPEWFAFHPFAYERYLHAGFGYLFYPEKAQAAVRAAFFASLRRRGALLTEPARKLRCPHAHVSGPKVSVIIRTFNRAPFLRRAIDSVLGGTFEDFELIVVDGGSSDGTLELLAEYTGDARVRVISSPRNVPAHSFNLGLAAARGKYVSELDSDDEYVPQTLERQVAFLESHPECALAISYYRVIDGDGKPYGTMPEVRHGEFDRNNLLRTSGAGAARTWHRCALEELGGFDAERFPWYAEDYDLLLRVSERYPVGRVHEALYRYRLHGSNSEQVLDLEARYRQKTMARRHALARRMAQNVRVEAPASRRHFEIRVD